VLVTGGFLSHLAANSTTISNFAAALELGGGISAAIMTATIVARSVLRR
jgi:hypothetical protein